MALKHITYTSPLWQKKISLQRVSVRGGCKEAFPVRGSVAFSSADLVVVANIQVRNLKTEVGKGFMRTVFDHEWIDPKVKNNLMNYECIKDKKKIKKEFMIFFLKNFYFKKKKNHSKRH